MQTALRAVTRSRPSLTRFKPVHGSFRRPQTVRTLIIKKYTVEHEAVVYDDSTGIGTVYITEHAQSALGDVVFVELAKLGTDVSQGDQIGAVESVKSASDIYAPVSGTVKEINETLSSEPGLLNKSAEDKGWLCKIHLSNPSEMDGLLTAEGYKQSYET